MTHTADDIKKSFKSEINRYDESPHLFMTCIIIITSTLNELPLHSFTVKALCMIAQKWCMVITLPSNKIT